MDFKSLSFTMFFTLLAVSFTLFDISTAFGGRKALDVVTDAPALASNSGSRYYYLNTTDPKVINLAKYVIHRYNMDNKTNLVFSAVLEAFCDTEYEQGIKYGLTITVTDGGATTTLAATVVESQISKSLVVDFSRKVTDLLH